ncbi:MAG: hypothetical protein QF816_02005, partial [Candidatus Scalindua sp.]|nr:hypothetical protein [Candidatus Scalindua sp.]
MLKFLARYIVPISIVLAIIVIIVIVRFMIIRVPMDQIGVKTAVWGLNRGVVQKDYKPGWHRYIRRIENWDVYDTTVQTIN